MSLTNASTSVRRRRQAGQVEAQPAGERAAIGFRRRRQARCFQLGQHEVRRSGCVTHAAFFTCGRRGPRRRDERPVRLVLGPFGDPLLEQSPSAAAVSFFFVAGGGITSSGSSERIRAISSLSSGLPGTIAPHLDGRLALVEPQVGLARGAVGAVAGEAVLGQDRADVAVVLDRWIGRRQQTKGKERRRNDVAIVVRSMTDLGKSADFDVAVERPRWGGNAWSRGRAEASLRRPTVILANLARVSNSP